MAVNQLIANLVDKRSKHNPTDCPAQSCMLCGATARDISRLCPGCIQDLPANLVACPVCARPMPYAMPCPACLKNNRGNIHSSIALFLYQYPVNLLIRDMKFNGKLSIARTLGYLIAEALLQKATLLPECIVPVPLHPARLAQRGYNPAIEIARPLAGILELPLEKQLCKRIKPTKTQTRLSAVERKQNMRNAFIVRGKIRYRHIAIIDDVMTTGATTEALAKTLVDAGATRIDVWACARASLG